MPRVRECCGWLTIRSKWLERSARSRRLLPPEITVDKVRRHLVSYPEYVAIVYEYVEEGENDPAAVQESLDFFWLAGFCGTRSQLAVNWMNGVLLDLSDIVSPCGYGWRDYMYQRGSDSALQMLETGTMLRAPVRTGPRVPHPALRALPHLQQSGTQASSPQSSASQQCDTRNASEQ